jgi:hypothetical protein
MLFEVASRLKVYLAKSKLIHVGNIDLVGRLAGILGCWVSTLPVKYLVFRWRLLIRPSLFGMVSLKR